LAESALFLASKTERLDSRDELLRRLAQVQDGFGSIVTGGGRWVVVQQGMNGDRCRARL